MQSQNILILVFIFSLVLGCSGAEQTPRIAEEHFSDIGVLPDFQTDGNLTMLKLYKRTGDTLQYHEAWYSDGKITEHWGNIGERGDSREHKLAKGEEAEPAIQRTLQAPVAQGFAPIDVEDHAVLIIEYAIEGFGTKQQLEKRHALQSQIDETLGWTGLGACDGGSSGSGTMEVCCYVVDFEIAKRLIEGDLSGTEFGDYKRIYREDE
jgi:hypothetical protein